jgi:D-alanyl-lipoteichoic acid acyltransferase DltB (MBOAT superfamily)
MAIGAALLFNIKLPINFNSPYKATDIQDFWRRWHMTLSRFLRDYIYIPLGGNRKGEFRTYTNLLATFIIGGIWHGAGWTFIFWGFLHGMALVIHRLWNRLGFKLYSWVAWFVTFNFINISWVFFRAKEWDDAIRVLSAMFDFSNILTVTGYQQIAYISLFLIIIFFKNSNEIIKINFSKNIKIAITTFLFAVSILQLTNIMVQEDKVSEFLYFNF